MIGLHSAGVFEDSKDFHKGTKGKSKSKCSPEEIRHAAQLNAWRESEDLPRKSPGSVTRAKARSAAFHAAKAAALDAQGIGPPAVKPPPPPPPPPRERRGERSENTGAAVRLKGMRFLSRASQEQGTQRQAQWYS